MAIQFGYGEAVVRLAWSKGTKNAHGQVTPVYTPETIENVAVDVAEAEETGLDDRQRIEVTLFLPAGTETSKQDQFIVRGKKYEADNDGLLIRNAFTGTVFPTEVRLKRIDG